MNYYLYFIEIKHRLFLLILTWLFTFFVCYFYKELVLFCILHSIHSVKNTYDYFIFTDVTEIFQLYIKLTFFFANQIALFYVFYHAFIFISPGLYHFEYKNLYFFVTLLVLSFIVSFSLLNILLMPLSWNFFLNFQSSSYKSIPLFFEAKISEYLNFYINLYYFCFITCFLSFFFYFFATNYSKNVIKVKKSRKVFYYIFFIISTLTTPPDVFSQLFISFVLICIYETIIFLRLFRSISSKEAS